jgi:hypothetical protein
VELPLQAHAGAKFAATPLQVRARGTFEGRTLEAKAAVHYPWQQTGYMRGPAEDQQMVLTVAPAPLFELEAPASVKLDSSGSADISLSVHWFAAPVPKSKLKLDAAHLPEGVRIDRIEVSSDAAIAHVFIKAGEPGQLSGSVSLVGSIETAAGVYRKAARDVEIVFTKAAKPSSGGSTP